MNTFQIDETDVPGSSALPMNVWRMMQDYGLMRKKPKGKKSKGKQAKGKQAKGKRAGK